VGQNVDNNLFEKLSEKLSEEKLSEDSHFLPKHYL